MKEKLKNCGKKYLDSPKQTKVITSTTQQRIPQRLMEHAAETISPRQYFLDCFSAVKINFKFSKSSW